VRLAQALVDPPGLELVAAFTAASFQQLGDLAYMRRSFVFETTPSRRPPADWPAGIAVRSYAELTGAHTTGDIEQRFILALERSYIGTLDCPELCGVRSHDDVLASHRAVGQFDPRLWWLVTIDDRPEGCLLLNANRDGDSVELVYIGLGPDLRGKRLAERLMRFALDELSHVLRSGVGVAGSLKLPMHGGITCAVDTRNAPALRLYARLGFSRFASRIPLIRALAPADHVPAHPAP
jgi:ribosomal protein S18 acetylase RimI-like enzyme